MMTRWLSWNLAHVLARLLLLLTGQAAQAQTDSTATVSPDSTVVSGVGGLTPPPAGLPSAEFETYNIDGTGVRYTATLTGLFTTGTAERAYFSTSHTGNLALGHWLLPAAASFSYGQQSGELKERELLLLATPGYRLAKWRFYTLAELETSNLRAISRRVVLGGGLGYQLYADTTRSEVMLSTFLLDENTFYDTDVPLQRHLARSSTRLKLRLNRGGIQHFGAILLPACFAKCRR